MKLETKRHSLAHVMAQAVQQNFPDTKIATGPYTEDGFYYDFDFGAQEFSDKDFKIIEKSMKKILSQGQDFRMFEVSYDEARGILKEMGEDFKIELVDMIESGKFKNTEKITGKISFYINIWKGKSSEHMEKVQKYLETTSFSSQEKDWGWGVKELLSEMDGDQVKNLKFIDMCAGPEHVENTRELDANSFKLARAAGAYWLGDEKNQQLTRIYAFAFENKESLDTHLKMLEEAKKRDHRILGKKLQIFAFDEEVGPGLPLWLPHGTIIVDELEKLAKETEDSYWYDRVRSPHMAKWKLYHKSGHLPYYEEDMFPAMEMDGEKYYLKAMNCPHHHKIYDAVPKSYRDLPIRYAEYWHCYRNEDSWSLFGLMRVRSLCMNDAHIYCTEDQFEDEFIKVIEMYKYYFELFWIDKYEMRLSKHSKEGLGKKYIDNEELWIKTEWQVRSALEKTGVPFVEAEWEWAFYWPKIDVQIWSAIGREFTLATNQLDFAVPGRFELTYMDSDGEEKTPLCIHRAPLSTHERFIGFLLEHFAGIFPLWLAPRQVIVLPVGEKFEPYARKVEETLKSAWVRVKWDYSSDWLNKKVRNAEKMHHNYILVVWEEEETTWTVSVRNYKTKDQTSEKLEEFQTRVLEEIKTKSL
jgi:threonyl-tRNA synthetase